MLKIYVLYGISEKAKLGLLENKTIVESDPLVCVIRSLMEYVSEGIELMYFSLGALIISYIM
jgi:hypothetical protein